MYLSLRLSTAALVVCASLAAQDIGSSDPKQRSKAARNLNKGGSEGIPQLAGLLKDPVPDVRQEAVRSIVAIGTQHSLDPLIAATRDNDPEVQLHAVDGLVNYYLPGYVESGFGRLGSAMRSRFDRENTQVIDPYVNVRQDVVEAIGKLASGGAGPDVRAAAARGAGVLRGKAALPDLYSALRSKEGDKVIYESLIAIQKIREPAAGPKVIFLLKDLNERIQVAAIDTTGVLKTHEAIPDLERIYRESKSDKIRRAALGSLAMLASSSSLPLFQSGFADKNDGVRASAAEGFARLKDSGRKAEVQTAFDQEKKMGPRLAEAFALVALGGTDTGELSPLTYLVNALNSRAYREVAQPYVAELAREAPVRTALYNYMRQGTKDEKTGLLRALAGSGDAESVAPMEALTKDSDPEVAQEAIRSLRNLHARLGK